MKTTSRFATRIGCFRRALAAVPLLLLCASQVPVARAALADDLDSAFRNPPAAARPWVYWYWMNAAVTPAGIKADLEAMKQAGIEGACLMPIRGPVQTPFINPPVVQLSPEWWNCVRLAFQEADRLGLKIAIHDCDGFATSGGPWITPEQSMQRVVWTETQVDGGRHLELPLGKPTANEGFYRDITVFAIPATEGAGISSRTLAPVVTTSRPGPAPQFLANAAALDVFQSKDPCWIQYAFNEPFTCRSITVRLPPAPNAYQPNTYQANRLILEVSDDGVSFRHVTRLEPPRHGWQDGDADVTHAIPAVTARYFRFTYDPTGGEPGAEDLDSAKWKPVLKIRELELSSEARLHEFEGKSGAAWRIAAPSTEAKVPATACLPLDRIVDVSRNLDATGRLSWDAPPGRWTILRVGHTSTGHVNDTGGGGRGLECDKFDPAVVKFQYDHWFGEAVRQVGPELAGRVLKIFHVDSWECASQNWSHVFRDEFRRRRGYDPLPWLPAMAGIPIQSADASERFLHDVRTTIAELLAQNFFGTLAELAHRQGCEFSSESVAPTMVSDGMAHQAFTDLPMGEFWLRSPTHDKINDILDAVSAARIYGHPIVQAEAFTELALSWDESPRMLKALQDRNYCFGINRFVYHVFAHNPWPERKPGMTLSCVGLFMQRNQTWWKPGRAWVDYAARCQALLQSGHAVADVAVFTGEEIPRRALVPWDLATTLPGMVKSPAEVMNGRKTPQIMVPGDWVKVLGGYDYDSINRDALLRLARVRDGRIELPGGASYRVLVVPAGNPMMPAPQNLSPEITAKLREFAEAGVPVVLGSRPVHSPSLEHGLSSDAVVARDADVLWPANNTADGSAHRLGQGQVVVGPFRGTTFERLGVSPDVVVSVERDAAPSGPADGVTWTHRTGDGWDVYFLSNQENAPRNLVVTLRVTGRVPELWDPVTGEQRDALTWKFSNGRTVLPLRLAASGSIFVVLRHPTNAERGPGEQVNGADAAVSQRVDVPWSVRFDPTLGGPADPVSFAQLTSWTSRPEPGIRNYSGTASYTATVTWHPSAEGANHRHVWLDLGVVRDLAEVSVNGTPCGVAWTEPFRVDVGPALHDGTNEIRIDVTNTWFNRIAGDRGLPEGKRLTWTIVPERTEGKPLLEGGLLGPVTIRRE